jgi:hypothetical protein
MVIELLLLFLAVLLGIIAIILDLGADKIIDNMRCNREAVRGVSVELASLRSEFSYKKPYEHLQQEMEQQRACYLKMKDAWMEQCEETGRLKAALAKKGRR